MKGKNKNKGFTLVELIVVITILAILGTIGFVTFAGYSADARNSKRTADLGSIRSKIELSTIKGTSIMSFVLDSTSILNTNISISGLSTYNTLSGIYDAGNINYSALGLDSAKFSDPITNSSYKIGMTTLRSRYEIAATIEDEESYDSLIIGNWNARRETLQWERDPVLLQDTSKGIFYLSGVLAYETWLKAGDYVKFQSAGSYKITKLKLKKIYVKAPIIDTGSKIWLVSYETRHLIKRFGSDFSIESGPDNNQDGTKIPYEL